MHLIYIDDSRDEKLCVFSALAIAEEHWRDAFQEIKQFRRDLKQSDGIYVYTELHAWKFVSGRGHIADRVVAKGRRCQIFMDALRQVANLPDARLFNAVLPAKQDMWAFERLLNRINRAMQKWESRAILICDEGKETAYTKLTRRMGTYNPIASRYGKWSGSGARYRNIPITRILEDPFFKRSERSYFIQLVDFCAYSLLRRERPVASKTKYGLDKAFNLLSPILVREANSTDSEGIIR
ncbi:MAG: DUF3800 domain-containing protein [bacterium]